MNGGAPVVVHASLSLDGRMAGPGAGPADPMGVGGEALHEWLFAVPADDLDTRMAREIRARVGAVVLGRRTFDLGFRFWEGTPFATPSFVLTHRAREPLPCANGSFFFVDGGISDAIARARAAANGKCVVVMGVETARQALAASLVDELNLQFAPVLLGAGPRLLDEALPAGDRLVQEYACASSRVVHSHYRIVRRSSR